MHESANAGPAVSKTLATIAVAPTPNLPRSVFIMNISPISFSVRPHTYKPRDTALRQLPPRREIIRPSPPRLNLTPCSVDKCELRPSAWFSAAFDACVYVQTPPREGQPGVVLTLSNRGFVGGRGVCGGSDGGVCFKAAWNPSAAGLRRTVCFHFGTSVLQAPGRVDTSTHRRIAIPLFHA